MYLAVVFLYEACSRTWMYSLTDTVMDEGRLAPYGYSHLTPHTVSLQPEHHMGSLPLDWEHWLTVYLGFDRSTVYLSILPHAPSLPLCTHTFMWYAVYTVCVYACMHTAVFIPQESHESDKLSLNDMMDPCRLQSCCAAAHPDLWPSSGGRKRKYEFPCGDYWWKMVSDILIK